jgi:hypothetical protein
MLKEKKSKKVDKVNKKAIVDGEVIAFKYKEKKTTRKKWPTCVRVCKCDISRNGVYCFATATTTYFPKCKYIISVDRIVEMIKRT